MTIQDKICQIRAQLEAAGFETARIDAELLLCGAVNQNRSWVIAHYPDELTNEECNKADDLMRRRLHHEPIAYILGKREFYGIEFDASPGALIPRQETEVLVDYVIHWLKDKSSGWIVDVGTGAGTIAIALGAHLEGFEIVGSDAYMDAVQLAFQNSTKNFHRLKCRIYWLQSSWLEAIADNSLLVVAGNLPYIGDEERENLPSEIKDWEPNAALFGGCNGIHPYEVVVPQAFSRLQSGGLVALEIAGGRSRMPMELMTRHGFIKTAVVSDLAGLERVVVGIKP